MTEKIPGTGFYKMSDPEESREKKVGQDRHFRRGKDTGRYKGPGQDDILSYIGFATGAAVGGWLGLLVNIWLIIPGVIIGGIAGMYLLTFAGNRIRKWKGTRNGKSPSAR